MSTLRHLALFLTESCNVACAYCFAANMDGRHIDEALARRAIELLFTADNSATRVAISFWGGEPLLCFPMLQRLVTHAEQRAEATGRKVHFSVPTNLTLVTDEMIDFLQAHDVNLSLSCDGDESSQAVRVTRKGDSSFPIVVQKLELVARRYQGRMPGVRMTVSPATAANLLRDVRFFLDRGFEQVYFAPVVEAEWTDEDLATFERQQCELADHWGKELRAGRRVAFTSWDKGLVGQEFRRRGEASPRPAIVCGAGSTMLSVDIYGDIYPCHRLVFYDKEQRAHSLGTVDGGLDAATASWGELDVDRLGTTQQRCRDCELSDHCYRVCPAINYRLGGDIHNIDERLCRLNAVEQRVLTYLERELGDMPAFRKYVTEVLPKIYAPGSLSAETRALFARVAEADVDQLADRAGDILARLGGQLGPKR